MTRSALINHALQTVLHLNKKYVSDVQIPRIQLIAYSENFLFKSTDLGTVKNRLRNFKGQI